MFAHNDKYSHLYIAERTEKAQTDGQYLNRSKSLDQLVVRRDSRRVSENYDSAVRSYENQFSNLEAALLGQGCGTILSKNYAHRGSPQSVARKQRYHDQNRAIFRSAIHGARTMEENSEGERFGKVFG